MYSQNRNRTVVIGGGLAGLSAAWKAAQTGQSVVILERSPYLGGRCMSIYDNVSQRWIDNCPHVFLECCTGVKDLFTQTGLIQYWKPEREFYFYPPGKPAQTPRRFAASKSLPGMLSLAPATFNLNYLSVKEKLRLVCDMLAIKRQKTFAGSFAQWLDKRKTGKSVRTLFYEPIVLSALSCDLDKPCYEIVRKVFVDSFFKGKNQWNFYLPTIPFRELLDVKLADELTKWGVEIRRNCSVTNLERTRSRIRAAVLSTGERILASDFVLATNFKSVLKLYPPALPLANAYEPESISCVHFWTDSPFIPTPHGVFPGRTVQWIFSGTQDALGYYSCVVSSGTNSWINKKNGFVSQVKQELSELNHTAKILRLKAVHWADAVHVPSCEWIASRRQWFHQTPAPENLALVGDWTSSEWPATMEAAVLNR